MGRVDGEDVIEAMEEVKSLNTMNTKARPWDLMTTSINLMITIIAIITMILHHHHQVAVITCTHYSSIQSIINGLKEDDFYSG